VDLLRPGRGWRMLPVVVLLSDGRMGRGRMC